MKNIFKIGLISVSLAASLCAAGCKESVNGTFTGEYSYENYGTTYGVKVEVVVENDKIKSVMPVESSYVEVTPDRNGWVASEWTDHEDEVYKKYIGKTVDEVLAIKVACDESGAPVTNDDNPASEITYDGLIHSGATLSSGRLLLAVQNALKV